MLPNEYMVLFEKFLGENVSGTSHMFAAVNKTSSPEQTIDAFATSIVEIVNRMLPLEKWSAPIWVSLLCDETGGPVVLQIKPKDMIVLMAGGRDREHIEAYRCGIVGSSWEQERLAERQRDKAEQQAREEKRERLRAKGQLYTPKA